MDDEFSSLHDPRCEARLSVRMTTPPLAPYVAPSTTLSIVRFADRAPCASAWVGTAVGAAAARERLDAHRHVCKPLLLLCVRMVLICAHRASVTMRIERDRWHLRAHSPLQEFESFAFSFAIFFIFIRSVLTSAVGDGGR